MKIFYFSSTGNSLYVAKRIKESFMGSELISIVNYKGSFNINEDVGFVYPIHLGSVPIVMEEFLSKLNVNKESYVYAVGVSGGGGAKLSFTHIEKLLNRKVDSAFIIKYISNYIRAGRNASLERAEEAVAKNEIIILDVIEGIKNKDCGDTSRGNSSQLLMYKIWKDYYKNKDKSFNINSNCTSCGICKRVCPVNNIEIEEGVVTFKGKCTDCMSCINLCPQKAINIGKKTINKERYKHPKIEIKELMH
ncbi:MAG: EFR1 family ferrodoxin [Clostridium sp.]